MSQNKRVQRCTWSFLRSLPFFYNSLSWEFVEGESALWIQQKRNGRSKNKIASEFVDNVSCVLNVVACEMRLEELWWLK